MAKYINADRLRTEIEKERKIFEDIRQGCGLTEYGCGRLDALRLIDSIIDYLQREQPEVDLKKIIEQTYHDGSVADTDDMDHATYENIARHFYELGKNSMIWTR